MHRDWLHGMFVEMGWTQAFVEMFNAIHCEGLTLIEIWLVHLVRHAPHQSLAAGFLPPQRIHRRLRPLQ